MAIETTVRILNFEYELMKTNLAEIRLVNVWSNINGNARTLHEVYSVGTVEGEEVAIFQKAYNLDFQYVGGNIFEEAMNAISSLLNDPAT